MNIVTLFGVPPLLGNILTNRLTERVTVPMELYQRLVHQPGKGMRQNGAYIVSSVQRPSPGETGKTADSLPLLRTEQFPTPIQRCLQRAMSLGYHTSPRRNQTDALHYFAGRQGTHLRRRQFQGKGPA